ncbi:MAG: CoA pyrophosphatase [Planctomycetota bacterium]
MTIQRPSSFHQRATIEAAMQLDGYEKWLPSFDVHGLNRPRSRPDELAGQGRFAAVLLMIYLKQNRLHLVLTRRRDDLQDHPGQVAFPGGSQDPGESIDQTAIRETVEEIGVQSARLTLIGELNSVYIPPSDFTVSPFVGWHEGVPEFRPSEAEVAELLEVDVCHLLNPETLTTGEIEYIGKGETQRVTAPYFRVDEHKVWGATAIMLGEFVDRLQQV